MIYKLINLIKNYKIIMGAVLFYFSIFISSTFIYLKFDVVLSPDFEKYYKYFEQYSGLIQNLIWEKKIEKIKYKKKTILIENCLSKNY